jgi:two-component system cell cycle response regulator
MVQKACRHLHLAGRYGGEEFVLVMPETDAATAYAEVEWLRLAIESECDRGYPVTVSIGLVTSNSLLETSATLFATADRALYASKQGGRNRVTAVDESQARAA